MDETDGGHRLPRNVIPTHYDIKITPDLKNFTFDGEVTISVQVSHFSFLFLFQNVEVKNISL